MYFLPLILDALCIVHVIKTGRDRIWIYAIMFIPMFGAAAYVLVEMLPGLLRGYHGQRLTAKAIRTIDPHKDLRRAVMDLELTDTVQNRLRVADANMALNRYQEAARLYAQSATGLHAEDTALLMGMARANFALMNHAEALAALDRLQAAHPGFQSHEAHLIYAASLEGLGRDSEARDEYERLVAYHPGEEARCRYAQLLDRMGETDKARACYEDILKHARHGTSQYRKAQARWVAVARQKMGAG